ncbi:hypothetical protein INT48_004659 [Thamnidium elegans]|uniref:Sorting nexin-4 n=1 Tax=Thamnidium elegans TaxID=101142 RepID=A0A8H7VZI1_9FUNG|nr:hypothetical protein INT48_004659 [Thamnidium elegans]
MAQLTDSQFNVQWDILQSSDNGLLDPLNEMSNEPAILSSQNCFTESSHIDIDISDKKSNFSNDSNSSSSSSVNIPQIIVKVKEPRKETEQQSTFISYLVESQNKKVRRRFQDFVWLHNVLYIHFPACFVPPLPDKHRLEYVKGDRFSADFTEKRRISLERFIQRIARHPILGKAEFFIMFLESSEFNDASSRALREGQETMMDTIGDSLLNAFSKIRKPDARFIEMKEHSDLMEQNLDMLQKTLLRTNKRYEDLCKDYQEFTASLSGLSDMEPAFQSFLIPLIAGLNEYTKHMNQLRLEDEKWQIEIQDYMAYYHTVKDVLKLRDQKQLDFEELSDYLVSITEDKIKFGENSGVASYITDKLNEVRGADADKIKRERLNKMDERVKEIQEAIDQSLHISTGFSDQIRKEDTFFNNNKSTEMYDVLKTYTDAKSVQVWRNVVQALEGGQDIDPNFL